MSSARRSFQPNFDANVHTGPSVALQADITMHIVPCLELAIFGRRSGHYFDLNTLGSIIDTALLYSTAPRRWILQQARKATAIFQEIS